MESSERIRLLLVDDDSNLLSGLRRAAFSYRDRWHLVTMDDPRKAVEALREQTFDIIISDMRMPGMSGAEVLDQARQIQPEAARVVLSGNADLESAMRSVRSAHQYLAKPCEFAEIAALVERISSLRQILRGDVLRKLIAAMTRLPSIPAVYEQLGKALEDDKASAQEVGALVARDPAMTAKVLQLVNSSFFATQRRIASPVEAVRVLGTETLRGLMLQVGVFSATDSATRRRFQLDALWRRSFRVAQAAQVIAEAEALPRRLIDACFTGGLLHSAGVLLLAQNFPQEWNKVVELAVWKECPLHEAAVEVLGCTDTEVAAYLLNLWGLPEVVVETVAFQHALDALPLGETQLAPVAVVAIASRLVDGHGESDEVLARWLTRFGLTERLTVWTRRAARQGLELGEQVREEDDSDESDDLDGQCRQ